MRAETHSSPLRLAIGLATVLFTGCALSPAGTLPSRGASAPAPAVSFLTELDYLEAGRLGVVTYLEMIEEGQRRSLTEALRAAEDSIVSVESVRRERSELRTETSMGTGILLASDRLVLTAGHVVDDDVDVDRRVVFGDGGSAPARVVRSRFTQPGQEPMDVDWGLLALDSPPSRGGSSITLGGVQQGALVFVLGTTGFLGLDACDRVVMRATTGGPAELRRSLRPLTIVARVESVAPLTLELVAGALPRSGMSGSPVFDLEGRLVGLLSGISMSNRVGGGLQFRIVAQSLSDASLQEALSLGASPGS